MLQPPEPSASSPARSTLATTPDPFWQLILNNDIQGSAEHAQDVLHHLEAVQSGRESGWSESGNAYVITISPEAVTLDFHWAGEGKTGAETISAGDLRVALQAWVDTLEQKSA